jgi:hypothetical protein
MTPAISVFTRKGSDFGTNFLFLILGLDVTSAGARELPLVIRVAMGDGDGANLGGEGMRVGRVVPAGARRLPDPYDLGIAGSGFLRGYSSLRRFAGGAAFVCEGDFRFSPSSLLSSYDSAAE